MDRNIYQDSDLDKLATMAAANQFENLLRQVQSSNLNFRIELSPFSAVITLKKSLIKNKTGNFLLPPVSDFQQLQQARLEQNHLVQKISNLENVVKSLKDNHENTLTKCETAQRTTDNLEREIEKKHEVHHNLVNTNKALVAIIENL